jgi:YbbR domain-containing protein
MPKLFENLWVKIAALLLAILLWFHVATEKVYQNEINLPLTLVDLAEDLVLVEPPPESVTVLVSAVGKRLLRTDWKKRGAKLVVTGSRAAKFKTEVSTSNLSLVKADKVDLIEVLAPREVVLKCEIRTEKVVPIRSRVVVLPDEGYAADDNDSIVPASAVVSGPRNPVSRLRFIETEEKIVEGVRNDFSMRVALSLPDTYGMTVDPDSVVSYVRVTPVKRRVFENINIGLINSPDGENYDILPSSLALRVAGKSGDIDSLSADLISVIADYILTDSNGFIPVQIAVPPSISVLYQSVDSVKLITRK